MTLIKHALWRDLPRRNKQCQPSTLRTRLGDVSAFNFAGKHDGQTAMGVVGRTDLPGFFDKLLGGRLPAADWHNIPT